MDIKKLELLLKLVKIKENFAAKQLAEANRLIMKEKAKLGQLQGYRAEYIQDYKDIPTKQESMSIKDLKRHRDFVDNLSTVIVNQQGSIVSKNKILEERKALWVNFNSKYQALKNYTKKIEDKIRQEKEKAEQKELDSLVNDLYQFNKLKDLEP